MSNENFSMFQLRVLDERDDLSGKVDKLFIFTGSETMRTLPLPEQYRLVVQLNAMRTYLQILNERIAAFR